MLTHRSSNPIGLIKKKQKTIESPLWSLRRGKSGVNCLNNPKVREPEGGEKMKDREAERKTDGYVSFDISKRSIKSLVICVSVPPSTRTSQPRAMNMIMCRSLYQNSTELLNRTAIFHWNIREFDSWWQIDGIIHQRFTLRWMVLEITLLCLIHSYYVLTADLTTIIVTNTVIIISTVQNEIWYPNNSLSL